MKPPAELKIYHIVHVDRLASIVSEARLSSDAEIQRRERPGTTIGMSDIKQRRLTNPLSSRAGLFVGDCVPFYFCPRSVMLFVIYKANHLSLDYRGGQGPIVHLQADLHETIAWADENELRWAFTLSNAGSSYFQDYCDVAQLDKINWNAVRATQWRDRREEKQAEFLLERSFPWTLVRRIGVHSDRVGQQVQEAMRGADHQPPVERRQSWYY